MNANAAANAATNAAANAAANAGANDAAYVAAREKVKAKHDAAQKEAMDLFKASYKKANKKCTNEQKAAEKKRRQAYMSLLSTGPVVQDINSAIPSATRQAADAIYLTTIDNISVTRTAELKAARDISDAMSAGARTIYEHEMRCLRLMNEAQ